jgi:hypothetical protein
MQFLFKDLELYDENIHIALSETKMTKNNTFN